MIRDYGLEGRARYWPYDDVGGKFVVRRSADKEPTMWPSRRIVRGYVWFGKTKDERGQYWTEYGHLHRNFSAADVIIAFAFVATHNHFVIDRGGKVFKQSAPVIKLPEGASKEEHLALLGVLNSSTACFWLKQVSNLEPS